MALLYNTVLGIEKVKFPDNKEYRQEQYSAEETLEFIDSIHTVVPTAFIKDGKEYRLSVESVEFVRPGKSLSDLEISLPELRTAIAHQMSHGKSSMNITDLLELVRGVYLNNEG